MSSRRAWFVGVVLAARVAAGDGIPDETWPKAWFAPARTASQVGIKAFRQSPMLDAAVRAGKLPPVRKRLPDDPIVVQPLEGIGRYGGTAICFTTQNTDLGEGGILCNIEPPLRIGPQVRRMLPNLARDWRYSADGKTLTLFLRKGVRWSDGHPLTAGDFAWWYEHIHSNRDITPVQAPRWVGAKVTAVDDYTVRFEFRDPNPFFVNELAHHGDYYAQPAHWLKRFHADFVPKAKLEAEARRRGLHDWVALFGKMRSLTDPEVNCPSLRSHVVRQQGLNILVFERNPYYAKVDPAGNQLPYIDRIQCLVVQNREMMTAKACTGQATIAGTQTETSDIPLFKRGERKCGYKTYIWNRLHGVDVAIQPNLTCLDLGLRKIFQDVRFRRALSLAIDRGEINQMLYFGHATPRTTMVIPSSRFYEKRFAAAYIDYDPNEARRLLDEMGVRDRDGDGRRDRPDGSPLNITLEWTPMETPKGPTMELVVEHWRAVGLDIRLKQLTGGLQSERARANLMQMTLWHADRSTDILFPPEPFWFVPMRRNWEVCLWSAWSLWYLSEGEKGEQPPPEYKQLLDWWVEMRTCPDPDRRLVLGKKILAAQAENVYTIGTVGLAPHALVVKDTLRNVPKRGYWGWDNRWSFPYHPETWYLAE